MVSNRITEGVGKKIVDALKKETDVEIGIYENEPIENISSEVEFIQEEEPAMAVEMESPVYESEETPIEKDNFNYNMQEPVMSDPQIDPQLIQPQPVLQNNVNFNQPSMNMGESFANTSDLEGFEIPSNVAVLKQLIAKLPSGVTKQTGAQIIRQTMEALGISMKSVLQEAQQVQEGLSNSSRECQATIMEYRRQIGLMEKQAQKYQRQFTALNDIISLFIQTNN